MPSPVRSVNHWFVYLLRCADGTLYAGCTNDLLKRLAKHNAGKGSRYVKARRPAVIVWSRVCESKSQALKEEARLKKLSRTHKESLVAWGSPTLEIAKENILLMEFLAEKVPAPTGLPPYETSLWNPYPNTPTKRQKCARQYSWGVPTEAALRRIAGLGPVVEMGAGKGYWARLLRLIGVDIVAFDARPIKESSSLSSYNAWCNDGLPAFFDVKPGTPEVLRSYSDRALFLCWPPLDNSMAADSLIHWRGNEIALVGCHKSIGNPEFWDTLSRDFFLMDDVSLPSWYGTPESLTIWQRR